ncbi:N-acetylmuramoyl-L-alanine amidase [Flammeovirgaceae bacterium SG7u.111]|nr:N-acetylmuramoyl-L-alanine amidase [Flammeovirgaceae bacterium SG7u.132]WPO33153.1 N-acetylmuramoyl-L-alanine amidase [Flammeovirgaceae bacterium SG7u.111]
MSLRRKNIDQLQTNMKVFFSYIFIFFACTLPTSLWAQQQASTTLPATPVKKQLTLVIDAGHGGRDPGKPRGSAKTKHEKDLNLDIALKLGNYVETKIPEVNVIYTRKTDKTVSLDDIVETANSNKANYFISIHCNSNPNKAIYGTRTHIHSHKFKPSQTLAILIEKQFSERAGRKSRGIMDARDRGYNLQVLQYTEMSGVLVEVGFLTNPTEEKYLNSEKGQDLIASAIFRAFRDFISVKHNIKKKEPRKTVYKVQIMASIKPIALDYHKFKDIGMRVEEHKIEGAKTAYKYRYMVGHEYEQALASKLKEKMKDLGFKDAFVVKLNN